MTIVLDFSLDPSWTRTWEDRDLRSADEVALRYDCFLGDVTFLVNGVDFSAKWGWIPVLDFALALHAIVSALESGGTERFEFTESNAAIEFARLDDLLQVGATYVAATAQVTYSEASIELRRFVTGVLIELGTAYPELQENQIMQQLRHRVSAAQ